MNTLNRVTAITSIVLIPLLLTGLALWKWRPGAIVLTVALLIGAAVLILGVVEKGLLHDRLYLLAAGIAVLTTFVLAWMNVAVGGILGDNPANMMYFGVLIVGLFGALIARLQPIGMSHTLFAMAFSILLIPAIALIIGTPAFANGIFKVFGLHAIFAIFFSLAGILFRGSAEAEA